MRNTLRSIGLALVVGLTGCGQPLPQDFNLAMREDRYKDFAPSPEVKISPVDNSNPDQISYNFKIPQGRIKIEGIVNGSKRVLYDGDLWRDDSIFRLQDRMAAFPNFENLIAQLELFDIDAGRHEPYDSISVRRKKEFKDAKVELVYQIDPENKIPETRKDDNTLRVKVSQEDLDRVELGLLSGLASKQTRYRHSREDYDY